VSVHLHQGRLISLTGDSGLFRPDLLRRGAVYRACDRVTKDMLPPGLRHPDSLMHGLNRFVDDQGRRFEPFVQWHGEKRALRTGDWYISGGPPDGYHIKGDSDTVHAIGELVFLNVENILVARSFPLP
jgi:hypothetical protein